MNLSLSIVLKEPAPMTSPKIHRFKKYCASFSNHKLAACILGTRNLAVSNRTSDSGNRRICSTRSTACSRCGRLTDRGFRIGPYKEQCRIRRLAKGIQGYRELREWPKLFFEPKVFFLRFSQPWWQVDSSSAWGSRGRRSSRLDRSGLGND